VRHLPNIICLVRIALIWPILAALRTRNYDSAMLLFALAAVSDGLDGYLAKRFRWTSELGKALDPLADKLLLVTVFVYSTWLGLVPQWLTAAAVARDALIVFGALTYRLWFGPLHGRPTWQSKLNTGLQLVYLFCVMANRAFTVPPPEVLQALAVLTLATTVLSGAGYVVTFTRRALALPSGS
jgi:cardiolipin synthase (CMP-forming)